MSEGSQWTTHSLLPGLLIGSSVLSIWLSLSSACVTALQLPVGCTDWASALPPPCSNCFIRVEIKTCRAIKHWILLALFLSPPETLSPFFSLPCSQAQLTKTSSGINTFQNTLQGNKRSKMKIMQNCNTRQWDWLRDKVALSLRSRQKPECPLVAVRYCCPHLPEINSSSGNVEGVSNHFSVFTFSRTH